MPSLTSIAEDILANAKRLDAHLSYKSVAPTSFDHDSLVDLPHDMESVRNALIDSTHTLKQLAQGPVGRTVETLFTVGSCGFKRICSLY